MQRLFKNIDLESSRLEEELEAERLKKQILLRVQNYKSEATKGLETRMKRVQKQTVSQLGAGSLQALTIQLAMDKMHLGQHEASAPAWEDFLNLAHMRGDLDAAGQLLLSASGKEP